MLFMNYEKLEIEYAWLEHELGNMDDYVMHNVINYQNASMIRFLYVFRCFRKKDGLVWFVLRVIDGCYLPVLLIWFFVCMI